MGGGSGSSNTSQTTKVQLPAWLEQASEQNFARAKTLAETQTYQPYGGDRVAGTTPDQDAAAAQIRAMQGQTGGALHPNDHSALRWVSADELDGLPWVPADRAWVGELTRILDSGPTVRPAVESDRMGIASVIVEAYSREFATLSRNADKLTAALTPAVEIDRFFVADRDGDVIGAVACTDHTGRAMRVEPAPWRQQLGVVRGTVSARILAAQWMSGLTYPASTGYLEFVAVAERARRQGVATKLVEGVIAQTAYPEFELEVTDVNAPARDCYRKIGFVDVRREREKFARIKGFRERIYMHYTR